MDLATDSGSATILAPEPTRFAIPSFFHYFGSQPLAVRVVISLCHAKPCTSVRFQICPQSSKRSLLPRKETVRLESLLSDSLAPVGILFQMSLSPVKERQAGMNKQ